MPIKDRRTQLAELTHRIYELLDAHNDTARPADALALGLEWQAHLDYLRGLQRRAREAPARTHASPSPAV